MKKEMVYVEYVQDETNKQTGPVEIEEAEKIAERLRADGATEIRLVAI